MPSGNLHCKLTSVSCRSDSAAAIAVFVAPRKSTLRVDPQSFPSLQHDRCSRRCLTILCRCEYVNPSNTTIDVNGTIQQLTPSTKLASGHCIKESSSTHPRRCALKFSRFCRYVSATFQPLSIPPWSGRGAPECKWSTCC